MNDNLYEKISNMTLKELISIIQSQNNKLENSNFNQNIINNIEKESTTLYDTNEMIESYPFFTRYNIRKATEEENLPYIKIGNKKFFDKEAVEKWISKKSELQNKRKFDI